MVRELIIETGAVRGRNRRALDSTVLDDAVARQDTVTQLIAAVRRVGREVPGAAGLIGSVCSLRLLPGRGSRRLPGTIRPPATSWCRCWSTTLSRCSPRWTSSRSPRPVGSRPRRSRLLALVAGQDVEPADGSDGTDGRWRIARKVAADRMISTVDPEARHTRKSRENRQDGFKAHLVVEPDTGLTTAAELTKANGPENSDATVGGRLLDTDPTIAASGRTEPRCGTSRSGRGRRRSGRGARRFGLRHRRDCWPRSTRPGRDAMIKPHPLRPAVEGGFTLDDFTYDQRGRHLDLPEPGHPPAVDDPDRDLRQGLRRLPASAAVHHRRDRSQRSSSASTNSSAGPIGNARRTQTFQQIYRSKRPLVERSIAWLTRGNRRAPLPRA